MKKRLIRIVSVCLSLIVFITSLNLSFLVKAEGTNPSVYINPSNTQAIYTYDGYYVVFNLNGSWTGGHNVGIQIYNTGNETIEDWTLESDYSNNISNIWNASVIENANGVTKLYHDTWNSVIYPNSCVEFGFSSNETFASFPTYFGMLGSEMTETNNELFSIDYNVTDEWEDGYTGEITITNNSENVIRNWALDFSCNNANISVWNARLISHEGNRVSVGNMGFNADINPGENASFGFIVYNKTNNDVFYDYNLYESTIVSNEPPRDLEPLGDIGEAFSKELRDEDVVFDEETGLQYVKNQILISAYMGTPREAIEEIVDDIGATIVGYIEITCDYQIEFADYKTLEELNILIDYINSFSYISMASLNLASEMEVSFTTNDYLYNDRRTFEYHTYDFDGIIGEEVYSTKNNTNDSWNEANPSGDNWNLEAMRVPSAWDHISNSNPVKVGVYDNYFEDNRIDKELYFDDIINNPSCNSKDYEKAHGTHVSGTIAAQFNNDIGISGVATDVKLYGYSFIGTSKYMNSMSAKVAYARLICNHVRIINVSLGYKDEGMIYAASDDDFSSYDSRARDYIQEDARILEEYLNKVESAGYDFLIVAAAGNSNNKTYVLTNDSKYYGYKQEDTTIVSPATTNKAQYGFNLAAIKSEKLKKRIIVVGSINENYDFSSFSNVGWRVDVCAPGEHILSTVPIVLDYSEIPEAVRGYVLLNGTSMATPHISGLAALLLQVNPGLNGTQLKRIICGDNNQRQSTTDSLSIKHNIPDAEKCILQALNTTGLSINGVDYPKGMIAGSIKYTWGDAVPNVNIIAMRKETGDYNVDLDLYSFSFSSDEYGEFEEYLPMGTYDIVLSATGCLPNVLKDVEIKPNEIKTIPVTLTSWIPLSECRIKGEIIDAISGDRIENATIRIRKNWNSESGSYVNSKDGTIKQASSSNDGKFDLSAPLGNYTIEIEKEGYITGYFNAISINPTGNYVTYAISPVLPENEYRIVLTWDETPCDLDSHLTYYDNGNIQFHVYFGNREGYYNNELVAQLDLDDTSGYGPETITITVDASMIGSGEFKYSVHNFSNEVGLAQSNACIKVYKGNEKTEVLYIPKDATDNVWHAFDITANGIIVKNEFYSSGASGVQ